MVHELVMNDGNVHAPRLLLFQESLPKPHSRAKPHFEFTYVFIMHSFEPSVIDKQNMGG